MKQSKAINLSILLLKESCDNMEKYWAKRPKKLRELIIKELKK
mgnify:CR=1 FL=1